MGAREEIIATLRGRYAVPVLSVLGKAGVLEKLMAAPRNAGDLDTIENKPALRAMLDYLASLGFLIRVGDVFSTTPLGQTVFLRAGAAHIVESYADYFSNLEGILQSAGAKEHSVDRGLNILGSGLLHERKFFAPALDMVAVGEGFGSIIDLGCGNGSFLLMAAAKLAPREKIVAVDLSGESTLTSLRRLQDLSTSTQTIGVTCSAEDVDAWSRAVGETKGRELISAWFVIHEFCASDVARTIEFFRRIHALRPRAELMIGEIIDADPGVLAANKTGTIMPEFLLFHALSGQKPLSWHQWKAILEGIPYTLAHERLLDPIRGDGEDIPSNIIWHLVPR